MADKNNSFSLTVYGSEDLEGYLARLAGGSSFEWHSVEREREAKKCFKQLIAAARLIAVGEQRDKTTFTLEEIRGQAWLQGWEIAKLTFVDFLERYQVKATFDKSLSEGYPLNTAKVFIPLKVFDLLEVLKKYPYPPAFGTKGLDLNSIRVAERKGGCVLELKFFGEACTIFCPS